MKTTNEAGYEPVSGLVEESVGTSDGKVRASDAEVARDLNDIETGNGGLTERITMRKMINVEGGG
jgi:hypothetical protein